MSKFYRFFKFDNDNTKVTVTGVTFDTAGAVTIKAGGQTITSGGQTITAGGQTITAGGQTITAGGQTVTAGDVKIVGGQFYAGNKIYLGGTTTSAICLSTGTVAPTTALAQGSIYIDGTAGKAYLQTGTATNTWREITVSTT